MKFPMPSFNLGMGIMRWAEELRKWADSISSALNGLDGRNGQDGTPGTSGCNCHDAIDISVAGGGATVLGEECRNKTVYVNNLGGGLQYLTVPDSMDGDYMVVENLSLAGDAYKITFYGFGAYGSGTPPTLAGGGAIYCRDDGRGGWFYFLFTAGIAGLRT